MPNPHNPINAFTHQSNTLYLCETHWKKKIPITTTTNTNSFLTTIIIFLNAAEWICCNWMSNFLLLSQWRLFIFIVTLVPSPHTLVLFPFCLTKLPLQSWIIFCLSNPVIHFIFCCCWEWCSESWYTLQQQVLRRARREQKLLVHEKV